MSGSKVKQYRRIAKKNMKGQALEIIKSGINQLMTLKLRHRIRYAMRIIFKRRLK